jgi:hypothetical protein
MRRATVICACLALACGTAEAQSLPDPAVTPGAVVSTTASEQWCEARVRLHDRDPAAYRRLVREALARQHISPVRWWLRYQFDHLIPWGLCGDDGIENEWMQPIAEAHHKDGKERGFEAMVRRRPELMVSAQDYFRSLKWRQQ